MLDQYSDVGPSIDLRKVDDYEASLYNHYKLIISRSQNYIAW